MHVCLHFGLVCYSVKKKFGDLGCGEMGLNRHSVRAYYVKLIVYLLTYLLTYRLGL